MRAHRRSGAMYLPRSPARARGTNDYRPSCTARRRPIFIPLCGLRKAIGVSGESIYRARNQGRAAGTGDCYITSSFKVANQQRWSSPRVIDLR